MTQEKVTWIRRARCFSAKFQIINSMKGFSNELRWILIFTCRKSNRLPKEGALIQLALMFSQGIHKHGQIMDIKDNAMEGRNEGNGSKEHFGSPRSVWEIPSKAVSVKLLKSRSLTPETPT